MAQMERPQKTPPVREGDDITATCEGIGTKGDGIFKVKGYTIFAKGTEQGKTYDLRITKCLPNVGFADVTAAK